MARGLSETRLSHRQVKIFLRQDFRRHSFFCTRFKFYKRICLLKYLPKLASPLYCWTFQAVTAYCKVKRREGVDRLVATRV